MTNPEKKGGLSPQHHGELNRVIGTDPGRYDEVRAEYADDPRALQQIDVYDGSTEYHVKFREFRDALVSGDTAREAQLQAWFDEHYPDLG